MLFLKRVLPHNTFFSNKYFYRKYLKNISFCRKIYYCHSCSILLNEIKECSICSQKGCYFFYNSMKRYILFVSFLLISSITNDNLSQISMIMKKKNVLAQIREFKNQIPSQDGVIRSIFDSSVYKFLDLNFGMKRNDSITLTLCSDGVTFYNRGKSIWPIMLCVNEIPLINRFSFSNMLFPVIFYSKKPPPIDMVLKPIILELKQMINGWMCNGSFIKCALFATIFDLPARSKFLFTKPFNGFNSCEKCNDSGVYNRLYKKMCSPFFTRDLTANHTKRDTNETKLILNRILSGEQGRNGILGFSPFFHLSYFDSFNNTIIDTMHCIFINISKMFFKLMFKSSNSSRDSYIKPEQQRDLEKILKKQRLPSTFLRKPSLVISG